MITKFRRSTKRRVVCVQWRRICCRKQREHFSQTYSANENKFSFFTSLKIGLFELRKAFSSCWLRQFRIGMGTSRLCPSHRFKNIICVNWLMSLIVEQREEKQTVIKIRLLMHWLIHRRCRGRFVVGSTLNNLGAPTTNKCEAAFDEWNFRAAFKGLTNESTLKPVALFCCDKITAYRPRANLEILFFFLRDALETRKLFSADKLFFGHQKFASSSFSLLASWR